MDMLGIFHVNQTPMCLETHQNSGEVGTVKLV